MIAILILLLCLVVFGICAMFLRAGQSQNMTPELGVSEGQLRPCPSSPNCVSSYADDEKHRIQPLQGGEQEFNALAAHIAGTSGADIRTLSDQYLWATYRTRFFGFVDDLELYFDGNQIQVRSASREGYSDLGANRARVETLRTYLENR